METRLEYCLKHLITILFGQKKKQKNLHFRLFRMEGEAAKKKNSNKNKKVTRVQIALRDQIDKSLFFLSNFFYFLSWNWLLMLSDQTGVLALFLFLENCSESAVECYVSFAKKGHKDLSFCINKSQEFLKDNLYKLVTFHFSVKLMFVWTLMALKPAVCALTYFINLVYYGVFLLSKLWKSLKTQLSSTNTLLTTEKSLCFL